MAIQLTEAAARHVSRYLQRRGKGLGLRLGVKTTGCSGLAYKLEYATRFSPKMSSSRVMGCVCWSTPKAWSISMAPNSISYEKA